MRPNLTAIVRVQGRIEEIERRVNPKREEPRPEERERFVDVLAREESKQTSPALFVLNPDTDASSKERPDTKRVSASWEEQLPDLAERYGLDEALVRAVVRMESGGRADAVSHKGAMGLMQLMPGTAKMLGVDDPFDPVQNLEGGIKYLSNLSDKYGGDLSKALAAYNAGPGRVDACGGIPPIAETQKYVHGVLAIYARNSKGED